MPEYPVEYTQFGMGISAHVVIDGKTINATMSRGELVKSKSLDLVQDALLERIVSLVKSDPDVSGTVTGAVRRRRPADPGAQAVVIITPFTEKIDCAYVSGLAHTPNPEKIIEFSGRVAYNSFDKITEKSHVEFIRRMIRSGHESVLEHATATVRLQGVSRSLTHQIVRHRLASFTQVSQRFVDHENARYIVPPTIRDTPVAYATYMKHLEAVEAAYHQLRESGIPAEDARFVLPNATSSEIVITANMREWRHILKLRGAPDAQWEIREVAIEIFRKLHEIAPTVFEDFKISSHPTKGLYLKYTEATE